jgi:hypothetical protein
MIHKVSGDILLTNAQVIAHGVAPNDDFHSGLALALREQWPALYKDFRHFFHQQHPETGSLWTWGGIGGLRIVNLFTQEPAKQAGGHPGKASTENVNHALRALHKLAEKEQFTSIALPRTPPRSSSHTRLQADVVTVTADNPLRIPSTAIASRNRITATRHHSSASCSTFSPSRCVSTSRDATNTRSPRRSKTTTRRLFNPRFKTRIIASAVS